MENEKKKIIEILSGIEDKIQMEIIMEYASKLGSIEWQKAVKDLIKRMDELNNKK